jgi:hypothetical protein
MVEVRDPMSLSSVFDAVPSKVRHVGTVVRRTVVLFPVPPALIVGVAGFWNPWNLDVFESGLAVGGIVPLVVGLTLVGIELSLTFHSMLIRLVTLAFMCLGGMFVGLIVFVSDYVSTHEDVGKTVAWSPDGRVRAELFENDSSSSSDPTYSLEIHLDRGFDRSTTILSGCPTERGGVPSVRFLGNRTLEYTPLDGSPRLVRFDKNLNTPEEACP